MPCQVLPAGWGKDVRPLPVGKDRTGHTGSVRLPDGGDKKQQGKGHKTQPLPEGAVSPKKEEIDNDLEKIEEGGRQLHCAAGEEGQGEQSDGHTT